MILGIGSDLCRVSRIGETLEKHGERFLTRCFAPDERATLEKRGGDTRIAGYAKRWAAKEACAKALGLGIRDDIVLRDIIVTNDEAGKPHLTLAGGAANRLAEITPAGMTAKLDISLSDEDGLALAFVVISAQ
jgi:holo-[acyl-carrier protein] synthase